MLIYMASPVAAKLQPLHNFSLTHLNWKNHRSVRSRVAGEASSSLPPPSNPGRESPPLRSHNHISQRSSTLRDSELEAGSNDVGSIIISESSLNSFDDNNNHKGKRFNKVPEEKLSFTPVDDSIPPPIAALEDEPSPKTWNLRPRRPLVSQKQSTGGFPTIGTSRLRENKPSYEINISKQLSELNNNNLTDSRKMKKQKFSIPLSRGEIEEDIFLLTGSKPSRRPKKRPRVIQKQLENLFPGLWLDSITAHSYKVFETPLKG